MVLGGGDHEVSRRMRTEEGRFKKWGGSDSALCNNMGFDELLLQFEVSFISLLFCSFLGT